MKLGFTAEGTSPRLVAPHAGAWIETYVLGALVAEFNASLLTQERGLKPMYSCPTQTQQVAPHAGAWIETFYDESFEGAFLVAPHAGAWIETNNLTGFCVG